MEDLKTTTMKIWPPEITSWPPKIWFQQKHCLFSYKMVIFPFQNNRKSVCPSYKMNLDLCDCVKCRGAAVVLWITSWTTSPGVVRLISHLSGPGCSKLTTSLVNVSLKFQMLISEICQYFLLKKCEKLLQCKSFSHFFNKKFQCIWL